MAIGPTNGRVSLDNSQDAVIKHPGATYIEAQANREDLRPDLSSSGSIKHAKNDQWDHQTATGCRIHPLNIRRK